MSAPTVKSRTYSSVVDNRSKLANGNAARLWSSAIGTAWTTIRLGCRLSIEDSGANIISTPRLAVGISAGTSNIFQDATSAHFFGVVSAAATWTRFTNAAGDVAYGIGNPGYTSTGLLLAKRIGSTLTTGSSLGHASDHNYIGDLSRALRVAWFLEITKGSPNFSVKLLQCTNGGATPVGASNITECSLVSFLSNMELASPSIADHVFGSSQTMAIDEATNGNFNAVCVAWDRTAPAMEVSDLNVIKFA